MKHLIIGNGPAGVTAAEIVRKNAPGDDILLLGSEPEPPYSRMAIPGVLSGELHESGTYLRGDERHFAGLRIEQKLARVRRIDSGARKAWTEDGAVLDFDRLLIATGSAPFLPFIPGIDAPGVHTCWTLADARRIRRLATPRARVILMGAGFIGCMVMEALASRGVRLTVIEKRERMLPNMMGEGAGRMIRQWCERKGIRVRVATRVTAIDPTPDANSGDAPLTARLSSGERLQADLVVCTTGVRPNIGFLRGSGIRCAQGVLVDETMQTNVPGIYAAGDCAEAFDFATGRTVITGVQSNAADQGCCAALNMTGRHAFQRRPRQIDVLDTLGLVSASFGEWRGVSGGQWVELSDEPGFRYLRLEFSEDVLVGSNSCGLAEHAGVLRELIRHRVALGEWKDRLLRDPTRLREAYSACARSSRVFA